MSIPSRPALAPISDSVRARKTLTSVQYFANLPDEIHNALIQRMTPRHLNAGQIIYLE